MRPSAHRLSKVKALFCYFRLFASAYCTRLPVSTHRERATNNNPFQPSHATLLKSEHPARVCKQSAGCVTFVARHATNQSTKPWGSGSRRPLANANASNPSFFSAGKTCNSNAPSSSRVKYTLFVRWTLRHRRDLNRRNRGGCFSLFDHACFFFPESVNLRFFVLFLGIPEHNRNPQPSSQTSVESRGSCRPLAQSELKQRLCNGLVMVVENIQPFLITCIIPSQSFRRVLFPRIHFRPDGDRRFPYRGCRRQFPLLPAFSLSKSKSQGQSCKDRIAIILMDSCFSHGQFYVRQPAELSALN